MELLITLRWWLFGGFRHAKRRRELVDSADSVASFIDVARGVLGVVGEFGVLGAATAVPHDWDDEVG
ncbi:hypothetical protein [Nocardia jiangxiensis]|uniref:hypothetical protein n=1 Tax=Nocardia jiangxiensis TaxID=282685 RepID=UPI0002FC03D0|nr:hypothetical protein [Nocardia jiangxiensis]